jgi:hypothetical protein
MHVLSNSTAANCNGLTHSLDVCDDAAQLALLGWWEGQLPRCTSPVHHKHQDERIQQQHIRCLLALRNSACQR